MKLIQECSRCSTEVSLNTVDLKEANYLLSQKMYNIDDTTSWVCDTCVKDLVHKSTKSKTIYYVECFHCKCEVVLTNSIRGSVGSIVFIGPSNKLYCGNCRGR